MDTTSLFFGVKDDHEDCLHQVEVRGETLEVGELHDDGHDRLEGDHVLLAKGHVVQSTEGVNVLDDLGRATNRVEVKKL